jgi:C_GCAxxG_C_C family probable redox protein
MDSADRRHEALAAAAEARAYELEKTIHGCAQCVLIPLMETFGVTDERAFKAASALGGGVGLSSEGTCGALAGSVMAIGLLHGRELTSLEDKENRRMVAYRLAGRLHERFVREYGSATCKEIHRKLMGRTYRLTDAADWKAFIADGGHSHTCPSVVGKAARWATEILLEHGGGETA